MNRAFIEDIINKVKADFPIFKKVDIFNNQIENEAQGVGESINFPALFLSFPDPVSYNGYVSGVQKSDDFTVRFYIAEKYRTGKDILNIFDLKQDVYKVFHGWQPIGSTSMKRSSETTDENREGVYVFIQDYKLQLNDTDNYINTKRVQATINSFSLTTDLDIENTTTATIRTNIRR